MGSYLGQNFLTNKDKIKEIVEALELKNGDIVIEIGPGHGELTEQIVKIDQQLTTYDQRQGIEESKEQIARRKETSFSGYSERNDNEAKNLNGIIAIEKDKELVADLKNKFQGDKNLKIIEGDALKLLPDLTKKLKAKKYKLIGNIPYYITGYLLRVLGELENIPELIVMMIQKEVAERVAAKPPKNNLLAASVQVWADVEILSYVSKKDFNPIPEVDSAIIKLSPQKNADLNAEQRRKYYEFIKILFKQPRKTILNNLRLTTNDQQLIKEKLRILKINEADRPQDLSTEKIIELSKVF